MRASFLWMAGILVIWVLGGLTLSWLLPEFEGRQLTAWVAPGALGISLPAPIKEYFARRQSIFAIELMRDEYEAQPDDKRLTVLDQRFNMLFEKVLLA